MSPNVLLSVMISKNTNNFYYLVFESVLLGVTIIKTNSYNKYRQVLILKGLIATIRNTPRHHQYHSVSPKDILGKTQSTIQSQNKYCPMSL